MTQDSRGNANASSAGALLALAALLGALALYLAAQYVVDAASAEQAVFQAIGTGAPEPNEAGGPSVQAKATVEALRQANLLIPPQPKMHGDGNRSSRHMRASLRCLNWVTGFPR